jgi:hypothetical protein
MYTSERKSVKKQNIREGERRGMACYWRSASAAQLKLFGINPSQHNSSLQTQQFDCLSEIQAMPPPTYQGYFINLHYDSSS